jgi:hypothetical protein
MLPDGRNSRADGASLGDASGGDAPTELRIGPHLFRWEPPDTGYLAYGGDIDAAAMAEIGAESLKFTRGPPRVFLIVDMAKAGSISAGARKVAAENSAGIAFRGIAVVGASRPLRVLAGLVSRAVDIMHKNKDNPTRFFATEAEARAWIAERRRAVAAR